MFLLPIEWLGYQERSVDSFTIHPYYSGSKTLRNDIAIIHTTESFKIAPNVNTICLPKFNIPYSEVICSSMGWGINKEEEGSSLDRNPLQNIMKQVKLHQVHTLQIVFFCNN